MQWMVCAPAGAAASGVAEPPSARQRAAMSGSMTYRITPSVVGLRRGQKLSARGLDGSRISHKMCEKHPVLEVWGEGNHRARECGLGRRDRGPFNGCGRRIMRKVFLTVIAASALMLAGAGPALASDDGG